MTTRMLNFITALLIALWIAVTLLMISAGHAEAHEGPGFTHPIDCDDVVVPEGSTCFERSSYDGQQDVDHEFGESFHVFHPVCEITREGVGSAVGTPEFVPCLPETGRDNVALAIVGGSVLAAGATMLILGGIAKGVGEADDA